MTTAILLIDDEKDLLIPVKRSLKRLGYTVHTAESGEEGWRAITETMYDLVISDLVMPGIDGIELLRRIRTIDSTLPVIIMTGVGTIENAVEAMKLGAYNYITKPFKTRDLGFLAQRAIEHGQLHRKLERINARQKTKDIDAMVIGNNAMIHQMLNTIEKVSASDASVLVQGETGTGKSMFAKLIHKASTRADKPFFTIDCGALAEQLLESELFGHVKGAFTGAMRARRGLLEESQGGTMFLDEIGELTPPTQVKLLRAIQEHEIKPVGGNKSIHIDVRFISATSRNLPQEVEQNSFRKDLYYRLAVIPLTLPPLRERKEDIVIFVGHFIHKFNAKYKKNVTQLCPSVMEMLLESPWKGNIRELENLIERAVLLTEGNTMTLNNLCTNAALFSDADSRSCNSPIPLRKAVEKAESKTIVQALDLAKGNRSKAAKLLGIGRRTLYDKMETYDID